ncbi:hypothetical protein F0919_17865 [Taibaiella lutea]|uniref:Uncharacterized protein n=1 Tax=Taibaiella lutea TaxID=2608001 RepID=A0A5M6CBR9_9BACT|nr:hypothetical protein [Taibaiella lutea]KAA5532648.1 hypothetical protein F0919_17865 [Taibaiella lutea]
MQISIKKKYLETKVGFGSNAKPLGQRTLQELQELALYARQSNSKSLSNYFEQLPTLQELQSGKTSQVIADIKSNTDAVKTEKPADSNQVPGSEKK